LKRWIIRDNNHGMSTEPVLSKDLHAITTRILEGGDTDAILREVSGDICAVFGADRLTIYMVNDDRTMIVSRIKTGFDSLEDLKLPISADYSIAGYVAATARLINIRDVYDVEELKSHEPPVYFFRGVDKSAGYRTKQVLAAPIFGSVDSSEVTGVAQLVNTLSDKPFPKAAEEGLEQLCKVLTAAFRRGERTQRAAVQSKYDHLVIDGVITAGELDLAIRLARRQGVDIEQILLDEFQVKETALGLALSKYFGMPYEPVRPDRAKPAALLGKLRRPFVKSQAWVPIKEDDQGIVVVTTDPERVMSSRIVSQVFPKKRILYCVCSNREFEATVNQFYGLEGAPATIDTILHKLDPEVAELRTPAPERTEPDSATVQLVNKIIMEGHRARASDIHVEPRQGNAKTRVRFRIDGSLTDYVEIPASHHAEVVARLKIMANLDIANKREPQDGKIKFKEFLPSLDIELRIATIPTAGGKEDVVMRILAAGRPIPLDQLGLSQHNLEALRSLVVKPYGLFLVCGPTGSGKTTTLHSVLGYINTPETKIWTAEDPVEITQDALRQVQINPRADLTFARVMRAFLRADPDVIMVGEMRDKETAAIGIEASLTGHRVLATLHTNSAAESIVRLLDMGMDPFNFADALLGVMAQRLAKRLCSKCKKPHVATRDEIKTMITEYCQDLKNTDRFKSDPKAAHEAIYADWVKNYAYEKAQLILYEPGGCDACRGTGYSGRVALHELLVGTPVIKKNIHGHAPASEVRLAAMSDGMRTLKQDGTAKVLQGLTNMQAVRAVCID
jgi:type II secretory ATPase GspE/PulE/Tfp pilus assembly ATPase PilB-like protein